MLFSSQSLRCVFADVEEVKDHLLHDTIFGPGPAAAGGEFLKFGGRGQVHALGIVGGVDLVKNGQDLRIRIAQAADFEVVLVDVNDGDAVFPGAHHADKTQLVARPLQEFQGGLEAALGVIV